MNILIIEDHADIAELIAFHFQKEGHKCSIASDGRTGLEKARDLEPDLILLDWMLPRLSGLDVCKALRRDERTRILPVIMLTAKGEEDDIVEGLEAGADDYVVKPFKPNELKARVKAVMRRLKKLNSQEARSQVVIGDLVIDFLAHQVRIQGDLVPLTFTEFQLLECLFNGQGRTYTRDQMIDRTKGQETIIVDRNIDVHISSLRKKLKEYGKQIKTVRGVGYQFTQKES